MKTRTLAVTSLHIRANRFDLLSRLANDLAHEIKNPLHAAIINLELLRRRVQDGQTERALDRARIVDTEIARVHTLTEWLLQLFRDEPGTDELLDVDDVIAGLRPALERIAAVSRVTLDFQAAGHGERVSADRASLRHAILNLVVNALEAMSPEGGHMDIATLSTDAGIRIRISDTGSGVPPGIAARIGEPGATTRPGHAGLGLAVARAIVEDAGGSLELAPTEGRPGATFVLALPRAGQA
ncbi:MAG TPA: HAMP domain-containing sensor histidine kinase [Longimicrobiales bacterium]